MKDIIFIFPIFFVGMFVLVLFILSKKGWSGLAKEYKYLEDFVGERVGITSATINGVNYNNCLLLKYNEKGLYFKPVFIFRLFHVPVMIPWKEVKVVRDKKILFVQLKELVIGDPTVALVLMKESTVNKLPFFAPDNVTNSHAISFSKLVVKNVRVVTEIRVDPVILKLIRINKRISDRYPKHN